MKVPWWQKSSTARSGFKVRSQVSVLDVNATVSELIDPDTKQWRRDLVFSCFNRYEAQQVLNIPISQRLPEDTLIWHWERDGMYSVKTAYHMLCEEYENLQPGPSSAPDKQLSKAIWHAPLPNKLKNFLWRLAKDIVPTRFNLGRKGIKVELLCPLCNVAVERTEYLFMHCQLTQLVWFSSQLSIQVPNCINLNSWLLEWLTGKDQWMGQIFCTTLWKIWNARNKLVFEKKAFEPIAVADEALEFVLEFSNLSQVIREPPPNAPILAWHPPKKNSLKINVDAGCFSNGFTCFGMVIRNNFGEVLFAAC